MPMPVVAVALTIGCLLAVAGLVVAERLNGRVLGRLCKVAASTFFVLVAFSLHATASTYGQLVLIALVLSGIGDVCLLSERSAWFLAGLGFFLLAHVTFSVAFAFGPLSANALVAGLVLVSTLGALALRWLWGHLGSFDRPAVGAYVVAIVAMCSLAVSYSAASRSWPVAVGALAFAASDLSVARDRFVFPGFVNKAWGLPVYYSAQLLLAWSVA